MKSAFLLLIAAFSLVSLNGYCQSGNTSSSSFKSFVATLDSSSRRVPVEKIHVHFDKPWYSVGDTIWMKIYVVNGNNVLSSFSQTVYVDLVSEQDSIRASLRLPLAQGLGAGAITLNPNVIPSGDYHVRVYTNWMRNFGEDAFFDKKIKIGDALNITKTQAAAPPVAKQDAANATADNNNIAIRFFPEAGELIDGLTSKIGFKAIGPDGLSRAVSGYILDKDNKQVAAFTAEHAGMGFFMLQPLAGNSYTAVIKLPDGKEKRISLPKTKSLGYTLAVNPGKQNVTVKISASPGLLTGKVILIAKVKDQILYSSEEEISKVNTGIQIPANTFPEGLVQFTLFSPQHQPVAERVAFVQHPEKHLKLSITPDKQAYDVYSHATFDLEAMAGGKLAPGSFSVAVTNEDMVPYKEEDEKTIFSNLLLTAELKGYIEKPNYYFSDTSANVAQQLDNLVLIQGWRKFTVSEPEVTAALPYQPEMGDAGISGRVLTPRGKPIPNAKIILFPLSGDGFINTTANETGFFSIDDIPFTKGLGFYTSVENNKNAVVTIDGQDLHPVTLKQPREPITITNNFEVYINNARKQFDLEREKGMISGQLLKQVDITEKKAPPTIQELAVKHSANLNGPGNADQVLTFMDLLECAGTLAECLPGRLRGVKFIGGLPYSIASDPRGGKKPMAIFIDGIERSQAFGTLTTNMVESIEVIRHNGTTVYGLSGGAGVLVITTKNGDLDYVAYAMEYFRPGSTTVHAPNLFTYMGGYDPPRQFYVPDYDNPKVDKETAGLRPTIYWNSSIATHPGKETKVNFFNGVAGNYRVIIEGIDFKGNLGRAVYRYSVK